MIDRRSLAGDVSLMAMAEALVATPQPMGFQGRCVSRFALQPPQPCTTVIEVNHEPFGLIASRVWLVRDGVFRSDSFLLEKAAQPQDPILMQERMMQS
jgi:hypothetical protein